MTQGSVEVEDEVYDLEPEIVAHYSDPGEDVLGYLHIGVKAGDIEATVVAQDAFGDVEIGLTPMIAVLQEALKVAEANGEEG